MSDEPRIRINGEEYELPTDATLGEQRQLKRVSGMKWSEIQSEANAGDPDAITGLLYLVFRRKYPDKPEQVILTEIEALTGDDLEPIGRDDEERPTEGAGGAENGRPETTPDSAGARPTESASA